MRLLLNCAALPDAPFEALVAAARRRHFAGLELTLDRGEGHSANAVACEAHNGDACFPDAPLDLEVAWLALPADAPLGLLMAWASTASGLGSGVLLRQPVLEPLPVPTALVHGTDLDAARQSARWAGVHGVGTAWEVRPSTFDRDLWGAVLDATAPRLVHVRLLGAGPEAQPARVEVGDVPDGTGWLLSRLALDGYGGTVSLAPSSPDALPVWERWLRRGRGWGCGTAAEKQAAVRARAAAENFSLPQT